MDVEIGGEAAGRLMFEVGTLSLGEVSYVEIFIFFPFFFSLNSSCNSCDSCSQNCVQRRVGTLRPYALERQACPRVILS